VKHEIVEILKNSQLHITENRLKILELFQKNAHALSHADIEKLTGKLFDRITIYRTLQTFVEKGIVHIIPTSDNSIMYALCKEECSEGHHHDDHVHFICLQCGATLCLEDVAVPEIKIRKGFSINEIEVVVKGICLDCQQ